MGRSLRVPRWAVLTLLFVAILVIDVFSVGLSVQDDGDILYQNANFTGETWLVVFTAIGIAAAILIVRWWSFRWWIADGAIWTSGGIFSTWRRRIAFNRIVTVDRSSTPPGRALGVSRIAIETVAVGQAAPDILLGYLSHEDAVRLERLLVSELVFADGMIEAGRFEALGVDSLGWRELILAGATTFHFGRAVVLLYAGALFLLAQINPTIVIGFELTAPGASSAPFVIGPFLGIVALLWLVATAYFVATFARFRLGKHEDWLILETGVIRRSRRLIRASAIQGLEISRSPLQRVFRAKRAMLRMRLPAYGAPPIHALVLHPDITDATLPFLTSQIVGMDLETSEAMSGRGVQPLAAGCRTAYAAYWPMRIAAGCGALLAFLLVWQPQAWWWALLPLLLAPPSAALGWLAWRSGGWYAGDGEWLLLRRGAFTLTSTAARIDQIRSVRWSQGLFARPNAPLALSIAVATSGLPGLFDQAIAFFRAPGNPSLVRLRAVDEADARNIANASGLARSLPSELTA